MTTIFISAGELSGDAHGARLCTALLSQNPTLTIVGFGGPKMKAAGVRIIHDMTHTSIVGLVEAFTFIPSYFSALSLLVSSVKEIKPDVFIPIDNQGFHMMALKKLKNESCKKIYYIAPQEWQWGSEKGGREVGSLVDHIISIFPEEEVFYRTLGVSTTYVGHPIVDLVGTYTPRQKDDVITIFPGSRRQEIDRVAPKLMEAASLFLKKHPQFKCIISVSDLRYLPLLKSLANQCHLSESEFSSEGSSVLLNQSVASLSTSGTITFEHACLCVPSVVAYCFHPITYFIAKTILRKRINRIKFMSLPNILMNREVFPEFLQYNAKPHLLANALESIIMNKTNYQSIQNECIKLRESLGSTGVVNRVAALVLSLI